MFLGSELTEILEAIEKDEAYDNKEKELMRIGVHVLRNSRKTPLTETVHHLLLLQATNLSSVWSVLPLLFQGPNIVLNTAVAEELKQFADILEKADDFEVNFTVSFRKQSKSTNGLSSTATVMTMHGLKKLSAAVF